MSMTSSKLLHTIFIPCLPPTIKTVKTPKFPGKNPVIDPYLSSPYRGRGFQIRQQQSRFGQSVSHDFLRWDSTAASPGFWEKQTAWNKPWEWIDGAVSPILLQEDHLRPIIHSDDFRRVVGLSNFVWGSSIYWPFLILVWMTICFHRSEPFSCSTELNVERFEFWDLCCHPMIALMGIKKHAYPSLLMGISFH